MASMRLHTIIKELSLQEMPAKELIGIFGGGPELFLKEYCIWGQHAEIPANHFLFKQPANCFLVVFNGSCKKEVLDLFDRNSNFYYGKTARESILSGKRVYTFFEAEQYKERALKGPQNQRIIPLPFTVLSKKDYEDLKEGKNPYEEIKYEEAVNATKQKSLDPTIALKKEELYPYNIKEESFGKSSTADPFKILHKQEENIPIKREPDPSIALGTEEIEEGSHTNKKIKSKLESSPVFNQLETGFHKAGNDSLTNKWAPDINMLYGFNTYANAGSPSVQSQSPSQAGFFNPQDTTPPIQPDWEEINRLQGLKNASVKQKSALETVLPGHKPQPFDSFQLRLPNENDRPFCASQAENLNYSTKVEERTNAQLDPKDQNLRPYGQARILFDLPSKGIFFQRNDKKKPTKSVFSGASVNSSAPSTPYQDPLGAEIKLSRKDPFIRKMVPQPTEKMLMEAFDEYKKESISAKNIVENVLEKWKNEKWKLMHWYEAFQDAIEKESVLKEISLLKAKTMVYVHCLKKHRNYQEKHFSSICEALKYYGIPRNRYQKLIKMVGIDNLLFQSGFEKLSTSIENEQQKPRINAMSPYTKKVKSYIKNMLNMEQLDLVKKSHELKEQEQALAVYIRTLEHHMEESEISEEEKKSTKSLIMKAKANEKKIKQERIAAIFLATTKPNSDGEVVSLNLASAGSYHYCYHKIVKALLNEKGNNFQEEFKFKVHQEKKVVNQIWDSIKKARDVESKDLLCQQAEHDIDDIKEVENAKKSLEKSIRTAANPDEALKKRIEYDIMKKNIEKLKITQFGRLYHLIQEEHMISFLSDSSFNDALKRRELTNFNNAHRYELDEILQENPLI